jgi:hypothetical protein
MKKCLLCGLTFDSHSGYANHIRWKHKENTTTNFSEGTKKGNAKRFGEWIEDVEICYNKSCGKEVHIKYRSKKGKREKYFCSRSCANSRGERTVEFKQTVSEKIKNSWEEGTYNNIDYSSNKRFSSKAERSIVSFFKEKHACDQWKSGGSLNVDDHRISRDMYSDKLKVCFEYDGVWHFKDINGQLKDKQHKDMLLEKWCMNNNYRLIRVQEGHFLSLSQIESLIYECNDLIVKIGSSY